MRERADAERIRAFMRAAGDLEDVAAMLRLGLVEPERLRELFAEIEPELYRFPAIDPRTFRSAVDAATDQSSSSSAPSSQ